MINETGGVVIEEYVGLKPKLYLFLVYNNKYKKTKDVNKNTVATIGHNGYKDVLLNCKCIRQSMSRIQCKDHRIRTYEIRQISLPFRQWI